MPIILTLWRWTGGSKFEVILGYIVGNLRQACIHDTLYQNNNLNKLHLHWDELKASAFLSSICHLMELRGEKWCARGNLICREEAVSQIIVVAQSNSCLIEKERHHAAFLDVSPHPNRSL